MFRYERKNNLPEGEEYDRPFPSRGDQVLTVKENGDLAFGKVTSIFSPVPGAVFYDIRTDGGENVRRYIGKIQVLLKAKQK
jgi:hypothetical protein